MPFLHDFMLKCLLVLLNSIKICYIAEAHSAFLNSNFSLAMPISKKFTNCKQSYLITEIIHNKELLDEHDKSVILKKIDQYWLAVSFRRYTKTDTQSSTNL